MSKNSHLKQAVRADYLGALRQGSSIDAQDVVGQALASGFSALEIYHDVLISAQISLGALWERGEITVAEEHLATQITIEQMARLRAGFRPKTSLGLRAVVATLEGEPHELGARVVADMLYLDGWTVDYLGPDTPVSDLLQFVSNRQVSLLAVSVTLKKGQTSFKRLIKGLKGLEDPPRVVVGGSAFSQAKSQVLKLGADAYASDAKEAVEHARKLCVSSNGISTLDTCLLSLGQRLQQFRVERGLSQKGLSEATGLDRAYISQVERGKQNVSIGVLHKLAGALEISFRQMLDGCD